MRAARPGYRDSCRGGYRKTRSLSHKVRKIVIATGVVTTVAGTGTAGNVDGTGTAASFSGPYGITTDGVDLYVGDYFNHKLRKIH